MCIVTINFVPPYQNLLTLKVQYTKNQAIKKWLPFELIWVRFLRTEIGPELCDFFKKFRWLL